MSFNKKFLCLVAALLLCSQIYTAPAKDLTAKPTVTNKQVDYTSTATEGYVDRYKDRLPREFIKNIHTHKEIVTQMLLKERELKDTHYVFYHAHTESIRIIPYFLRELWQQINKKSLPADFDFLRHWESGSPHKNAQAYLDSFKTIPGDFDNDNAVRQYLIAVNPVLFGNHDHAGECTFAYFNDNRSIGYFAQSQLTQLFKKYGLNETYMNELLELNTKYASQTGDIVQIFIPRTKVDEHAYVCRPYGIPYDITRTDKQGNPIAPADFDAKRKRYIKIAGVLQVLHNIKGLKSVQLRIFINNELLNPASGIKIIRYTSLEQTKLTQYEQDVKRICKKTFAAKWGTVYESGARIQTHSTPKKEDLQIIINIIENLPQPTIFEAIESGDLARVKTLFEKGINLETKNDGGDGRTPLLYAIECSQLDIAKYLVEKGANLETKSSSGFTPLLYAIYYNKVDIAKYLVEKGANIEAKDSSGDTPLLCAALSNNIDIIKYLVEKGAHLEAINNEGKTALKIAKYYGHTRVAKYLRTITSA